VKDEPSVIEALGVADFPLHHLPSDREFESLVWDICRDILGEGVTKFSDGRDGGRDAKFNGTANSFPSKAAPLNGRVIIQAKWTSSEVSSCSETGFQNQLLKEEAKKAKKLCEAGELDHWIIFTNRKKSGGADAALEKALLAATGAKTVHLRGREDICGYIRGVPELIRLYNLQQFLPPLRVHPDELRTVVTTIHKRWPRKDGISSFNFDNYKGIDAKNLKNGMRADYFQYIKDSSEPHFKAVKEFLENPRNAKLVQQYHDVADEFQHKIVVHRNSYTDFAEIIDALYDEITGGANNELVSSDHRRLTRVALHYMYCNCDIGDKP
jgi:hypothetical protein